MQKQILLTLLVLLLEAGALLNAVTNNGFVTRKNCSEPVQLVNVRVSETKTGTQTIKTGYYVLSANSPGTYILTSTLKSSNQSTDEIISSESEVDVFQLILDVSGITPILDIVSGLCKEKVPAVKSSQKHIVCAGTNTRVR